MQPIYLPERKIHTCAHCGVCRVCAHCGVCRVCAHCGVCRVCAHCGVSCVRALRCVCVRVCV